MEVHQHSHTARKKWTHYFWEFLMLFLAVFCGFLAENLREHQVEHRRELQYMRALLTDIRGDTLEINKSISTAANTSQYEDSLLFYLYNYPPVDFLPDKYLTFDFNALRRIKVVFNEITALQLKNAGNMRLVRNLDMIREISLYWKEQDNTQISLDRYLVYRNRGREFAEKLFAYSETDLVEAGLIKPLLRGVRVIQANPAQWSEYANIISHCKITLKNLLEQLQKQLKIANELMVMLEKEYHLE